MLRKCGLWSVRKTSELLKELDINIPDLNSKEITVQETEAVSGDLSNMLNLGNFINSGIGYTITGYDNYSVKKIEDDFFGAKVYENQGADKRKIFNEIVEAIVKNIEPIRPNRHFERKKKKENVYNKEIARRSREKRKLKYKK